GDYALLENALLAVFCKTPEGYRNEFQSARISAEDTYKQFVIRLGRLLDFWTESCEVVKTYKGFRAYVLMDEFLSSLSPDLRMYVKEKNVSTLKEIIDWAMAYKTYGK
ncbi:SCAN domain, partial [Trinorchestia longiramus]